MTRWLRNLFPSRPSRADWYALAAELYRNEDREDTFARLPGVPLAGDVNGLLDRIFTLRERRVEILRALGWDGEAGGLAADTAMRRSWLRDDDWGAP